MNKKLEPTNRKSKKKEKKEKEKKAKMRERVAGKGHQER